MCRSESIGCLLLCFVESIGGLLLSRSESRACGLADLIHGVGNLSLQLLHALTGLCLQVAHRVADAFLGAVVGILCSRLQPSDSLRSLVFGCAEGLGSFVFRLSDGLGHLRLSLAEGIAHLAADGFRVGNPTADSVCRLLYLASDVGRFQRFHHRALRFGRQLLEVLGGGTQLLLRILQELGPVAQVADGVGELSRQVDVGRVGQVLQLTDGAVDGVGTF